MNETTFVTDRSVNPQNIHYRSDNNPLWLRKVQHQYLPLESQCMVCYSKLNYIFWLTTKCYHVSWFLSKSIIRRCAVAITAKYVFATRQLCSPFFNRCTRTFRSHISLEVDWSIFLVSSIPRLDVFGSTGSVKRYYLLNFTNNQRRAENANTTSYS